jgi:hypothetical protein
MAGSILIQNNFLLRRIGCGSIEKRKCHITCKKKKNCPGSWIIFVVAI